MTIKSVPPSSQGKAMLKALQAAVAKNLEKKQRLGQYAVTWQHNQAILVGDDAPQSFNEDSTISTVEGE